MSKRHDGAGNALEKEETQWLMEIPLGMGYNCKTPRIKTIKRGIRKEERAS